MNAAWCRISGILRLGPRKEATVTPTEYREALKRLGLSQEGAARMAGYHPRTGQRWADPKGSGPPRVVALLVEVIERNRHLDKELWRARERIRVRGAAEDVQPHRGRDRVAGRCQVGGKPYGR